MEDRTCIASADRRTEFVSNVARLLGRLMASPRSPSLGLDTRYLGPPGLSRFSVVYSRRIQLDVDFRSRSLFLSRDIVME